MSYFPQVGPVLYTNKSIPSGNTVANTTALTNFASSFSFPANFFVAGQGFMCFLAGRYSASSVSTTTCSLTLGGTTILTSPALANVLGGTNLPFSCMITGVCQSTGTSGSIETQGVMMFQTSTTAPYGTMVPCGTGAPVTINTTGTLALQAAVQFSLASAGISVTLAQMIITSIPVTGLSS